MQVPPPAVTRPDRSPWSDAWDALRRNRAATTALFMLLIMAVLVIVAPLLSPYAYDQTDFERISTHPALGNGHIFGTDALGRDLFVRTLFGGRISLLVAMVATAVSLVIGVGYGALAGYVGGRMD